MTISPEQIQEKILEITSPGQYFEVEERRVGNQTVHAYKNALATVVDILQGARQHGGAEFIVYEGKRHTYDQFFAQVDGLAATLQRDFGVAKGDRVAIAMRNCPEWAIAYAAANLIGAIAVPLNSWGKTEELRFSISDCGAKCLICDEARFKLVADILDELDVDVLVSSVDERFQAGGRVQRFDQVVARGHGRGYQVVEAAPEDICVILYTSGTTGFPKGAAHRHIAVTQSLMNMLYLGFLLMNLEGPREYKGGAQRETPLLTVPLFHATGLLSGFFVPLQMGQKVAMMYRWDSQKALQLIEAEKVTALSTVPTILQELLAHPEFDRYDTSSLIRVAAAGAATPAGLPELIQAKLGNPSRSAGYGMTETMAIAATMSGAIFDLKPNASGIVPPIIQFRTMDSEGRVLPSGEQGEIQLKGVTCMPGYWEKPDANQQVFTEDGWLRTGDVGLLDRDGFVHITGRIKEIVIRGGENIYPGEIENIAYQHDAIRDAVVFGVNDPQMGEELAMVCYLHQGRCLNAEQMRQFLGERLARYKVPKYIAFSTQPLPRNASEKLHKLNVKAAFLDGQYPVQ